MDDGSNASRVVVGTLLKEVTERQDFFCIRTIGPANHSRNVRVDSGIVAAVHVGPDFHWPLLQKIADQAGAAGCDGEADQRCAVLCKTPPIIAEGIYPPAFILQVRI